jgi:hypothetical protein
VSRPPKRRRPTRDRLIELENAYFRLCNPYDLHGIKPLLKLLMRKSRSVKAKEEALNRLISDAMKEGTK